MTDRCRCSWTASASSLKLPYDRYLEAGFLRAPEPDFREQLGLE